MTSLLNQNSKEILLTGGTDGAVVGYDINDGLFLGMFPAMFDSIGAIDCTINTNGSLLVALGSG